MIGNQIRLVIDFTESVNTDAVTDGLGEWMRELEAGDGLAKLGIRDWRFEDGDTTDSPAIIVAGNICDGFRFIGPFENWEAAAVASERLDEMTWITLLEEMEEK